MERILVGKSCSAVSWVSAKRKYASLPRAFSSLVVQPKCLYGKTLSRLPGLLYLPRRDKLSYPPELSSPPLVNGCQIFLKCYYDQKIHFPFSFRFWKRVCLTPGRQNFELRSITKGGLLWVQVLDFTVRHYSRSKMTDWTSEGWIEVRWRQRLTSLKLQRVNAAYYTCKTRV